MTPDDWARLDAILDAALDLPPDEQAAYLDAQHLPDRLRQRAEAMLDADATDAPLLDDPARLGVLADAAEADGEAVPPGTEIGPYRVIRPIGQGGMGTVLLAERADGAFEKQVALKLVRPGLAGGLLARFRAERRILARLEHPGIARLLDGGRTDDGRPYLVMEYVDGAPLTGWADSRRLSVDARLDLFGQVCDAVAYAHRQLVVHRDLKPSNILVTEGPDGQPRVKLLDFGIAKLLGSDDGLSLVETRTEQRLLTPAYAAPEQVRGEPPSTATDVYALGVLLYELLTGRRPYDLPGRARHAVEQAILHEPPTRPSTAVTDADATTEARGTEPGRLRRRLAGDLDQIVLAALRKEPERRYGSAADLGRDVRRHLDRQPIEARPDAWGYRASRFVRRHRAVVAASVVALAGLVGGLGAALVQADRASGERDRAEASFAYVQRLLAGMDPSQRPRADTLLARHLLDAGARDLATVRDPAVAGALAHSIGRAYYELSLYPEAAAVLHRADSLLAGSDTARASALALLGSTELNRQRADQAETAFRAARDLRASTLGRDHPLTLLAHVDLCGALRLASSGAAFSQCREELETRAQALAARPIPPDADHYRLFVALSTLAANVRDLDAATVWHDAADRHQGLWSSGPLDRGRAQTQRGAIALQLGRPREAVRHYEAAHRIYGRVYAPDHPLVLYARNNLAATWMQAGEPVRAERLLREAAPLFDALGPMEEVSNAFISRGLWARALTEAGRGGEAERIHADLLPRMTRAVGPDDPFLLSFVMDRAHGLRDTGRPAEAEVLLRDVVARFAAHHPDHFRHGEALVSLGSVLALRDAPETQATFAEGIRVLEATLPADMWRITVARSRAGAHAASQGNPDAPARLASAASSLRASLGPEHPLTREAEARAARWRSRRVP